VVDVVVFAQEPANVVVAIVANEVATAVAALGKD
jgi:hypothetical protein